MYVCELCKESIIAKSPSYLIDSVRRLKKYPRRIGANQYIDPEKPGKRSIVITDDPGGTGFETAKEIRVCLSCRASASPPLLE